MTMDVEPQRPDIASPVQSMDVESNKISSPHMNMPSSFQGQPSITNHLQRGGNVPNNTPSVPMVRPVIPLPFHGFSMGTYSIERTLFLTNHSNCNKHLIFLRFSSKVSWTTILPSTTNDEYHGTTAFHAWS